MKAVKQSPRKVVPMVSARLSRVKKAPSRALLNSLLAKVPAAVITPENCSWLADEAVASGISVIVTAVVAVIVGI
jgi:hypothetical protein